MKKDKLLEKHKQIKQKLVELESIRYQKAKEARQERKEARRRLYKAFGLALIKNKKYFLSFIITMTFISIIVYNQFTDEVDKINIANDFEEEVVEAAPKVETDEELDVSKYVGVYSREITLNNTIKLNSCDLSNYKLAYKIESNKKISKYFISDCTGITLIYDDTLSYYNTGGARYIGSSANNFIFGTNSMKELEGETYKIDDTLSRINVKSLDKNIESYFLDGGIVISTLNNVYLLKESVVSFEIPSSYENKGGNLDKRVYKQEGISFKVIIFSNDEKKSCYDDDEAEDEVYSIYQISYNKDKKEMDSMKKIITRTKKDGCKTYNEDLATLKSE